MEGEACLKFLSFTQRKDFFNRMAKLKKTKIS